MASAMRRRINKVWSMAALAVLAAMIAGGEARAGAIVIVSGTTEQTGDPLYTYFFDVQLVAGNTLEPTGFFTIYDMPGVASPAPTTQPNILWGASQQLTGKTPLGVSPPIVDDPTIENATWQWNGTSPIVAPAESNLDLGIFTIQTTELAAPPTPTLVYVGSLDGVNASNPPGTITVVFVPEPMSILLLSQAAVFGLAVYARGRRRRPAAPGA